MPIVKRFLDANKKYQTKYSGANVTTALTAIKPIMDARYEAAASVIYNAQEIARRVLSANGVPPGLWAPYIAFAEQIAKFQFSHGGLTLQKVLSGLKSQYVTAHDCDPIILDAIIQEMTGLTPPY
jgi:hypothetical protein